MKYFSMFNRFSIVFLLFFQINLAFATAYNDKESVLTKALDNESRGDINSSIGLSETALQFETTEKDEVVSIRFSPTTNKLGAFLKLSFPVNKDTKDTNVKDFDGLKHIDSVQLGFRWYSFGDKSVTELSMLRKLCEDKPELFSIDQANINNVDGTGCYSTNDELFNKFDKSKADEAALVVWESSYPYSIEGTHALFGNLEYGKEDYEFFSADDATSTDSAEEESWSAKAGWAYYLPSLKRSFVVELEYTENFSAQDTESRCPTSNTGNFSTCLSNAGGKPEKNKDKIISVSWRQNFNGWAIAPGISYDDEDEATKVSIPVYLYKTGDTLDTGIRADWDDVDHDWVYSAFISKSFSLFE